MAPTFVALGPGSSFFAFINGRAKVSVSSSTGISDAYMTMKSSKGTPCCCAFGTESFFLSFKERQMDERAFLEQGLEKNYPHLYRWMQSNKNWNTKDFWVTLGPNGSYWSWSKTHGTSYHNVPQRLLEKVKEYDGTAPRVTLGADDSFIYWDEEGQWFCSLYDYPGAYERLVKQMDKHENVKIVAASLSAFNSESYFILLSNGAAMYKVVEENVAKVDGFIEAFRNNLTQSSHSPKGSGPLRMVSGWHGTS